MGSPRLGPPLPSILIHPGLDPLGGYSGIGGSVPSGPVWGDGGVPFKTLDLYNGTVYSGSPTVANSVVPLGMVLDPASGNVFVGGSYNNMVTSYNTTDFQLTSFLPTGGTPSPGANDPNTGAVFVGINSPDGVDLLNGSTGRVTMSVNLSSYPCGMSFDPGNRRLYVLEGEASQVQVFNASTLTLLGNIAVGLGGRDSVNPIAVDPQNGDLYVTNNGSGTVSVIDGASDSVVATIPVGSNPYGVTVDEAQREVFVANYLSDNVSIINATRNVVAGSFPAGQGPVDVVWDATTGLLYVSNRYSDNLTVLNPTLDTSLGVNPIGPNAAWNLWNLALDASGRTFYATLPFENAIALFNASTFGLIRVVHIGSEPFNSALDPVTGQIWIANGIADNVTILDSATHALVRSVPVGTWPDQVAFDPALDLAFVSNDVSGSVSILNASTGASIGQVLIGPSSWLQSIAYDPDNGLVYVADSGTPAGISVINASTGMLVGGTLGSLPVEWVTVNPVNGDVFASFWTGGTGGGVSVLSGKNDSFLANITLSSQPWGLTYDARTGMVYAASAATDTVTAINATTFTVSASYNPPSPAYFVTVDPLLNVLYASGPYNLIAQGYPVEVLNLTTGQWSVSTAGQEDPYQATFVPANGEVAIPNAFSGTVSFLSPHPPPSLLQLRASPSTGEVGVPLNFTATVFGGNGPLSYSYTGLPPGCFSRNVSSLMCVPSQSGGFVIGVWVNDSLGLGGMTLNVILNIGTQPVVSNFQSPKTTLDANETTTLTVSASGMTPLSYAYSGLPPGCLSANLTSLNCTPVAAGIFNVTVWANDTLGGSAHANLTLVVYDQLAIHLFQASRSIIDVGSTVNWLLNESGGLTPSTLLIGVPPGCPTDPISPCTPSAPGQFMVQVQMRDGTGATVSAQTLLTVNPDVGIHSVRAVPASVTVGESTQIEVNTSGGSSPVSYAYAGLPPGCSSANTSSLLCKPTVAGSYLIRAYVNDSVGGSADSNVTLVITRWANYAVTFAETGVPPGTSWFVNLNGTRHSSTTSVLAFSGPNGSYTFSVGGVAGYTAVPSSGNLVVNGADVTRAIVFTKNSTTQTTYNLAFTETGLTTGTNWSVTLDGSTMSSTTPTVTFHEANGSYTYSVASIPGYTVSPSSGSIPVNGHAASQSLRFTSSPTPKGKTNQTTGLLGLPGYEGYLLIGVVVAIVAVALAMLLMRKGNKSPRPAAKGKDETKGMGATSPESEKPGEEAESSGL